MHTQAVKVIGSNGQLSLGKEFAGRQVLIESEEPGVWVIRTATVVPDNELYLHTAENRHDLDEAMAWAAQNPPQGTTVKEIRALAGAKDGRKKTAAKRRS